MGAGCQMSRIFTCLGLHGHLSSFCHFETHTNSSCPLPGIPSSTNLWPPTLPHTNSWSFLSFFWPSLWPHPSNCRHKRDSPPPALTLFDFFTVSWGRRPARFVPRKVTSICKWNGANTLWEQGYTCSGLCYLCQV